MAYSAVKVANRILELGRQEGASITPLKLLKLVYIANGWSLGLRNEPLVREGAQAWQYGPVIPDLYQRVRDWRGMPITKAVAGDYDSLTISPDDDELIQLVWRAYRGYTALQLSDITHQPGTPWSRTYKSGENSVIPEDLVRDHYVELAKKRPRVN